MSELKFYSQYDEDKVIYNKFFKDNNPETTRDSVLILRKRKGN